MEDQKKLAEPSIENKTQRKGHRRGFFFRNKERDSNKEISVTRSAGEQLSPPTHSFNGNWHIIFLCYCKIKPEKL